MSVYRVNHTVLVQKYFYKWLPHLKVLFQNKLSIQITLLIYTLFTPFLEYFVIHPLALNTCLTCLGILKYNVLIKSGVKETPYVVDNIYKVLSELIV